MTETLLQTKLHMPPIRPNYVLRPRLIDRLKRGLQEGCKLTLISAPAGFGKTTLVSNWAAGCGRDVAWLSLDEGDNNLARFLTYLVAALQRVAPAIGQELPGLLQTPQPPSEAILTLLLNDAAAVARDLILVLDDYHVIDVQPVDDALAFLLEHLPRQLHLVMADPVRQRYCRTRSSASRAYRSGWLWPGWVMRSGLNGGRTRPKCCSTREASSSVKPLPSKFARNDRMWAGGRLAACFYGAGTRRPLQ